MTLERFVIVASTALSLASIFYIPKDKYRLALISLLLFQAVTWAASLIFLQIGMYMNQVREFTRATQLSFLINYFVYPMIFVWFILIFPNNASRIKKVLHYFIFASIGVWFIYFISTYTNLQKILLGTTVFNIIFAYIRVLIYLLVCQIYIIWFSKVINLPAGE